MMDDNRLDNIVKCAYNMDNGYVEVWYVDGNMLRIKCEEVEAALRTTEQSLAKLHKLLDNKPIEYVAMALSGEMQAYCDIEDEMVKGMFGTIVQGYLKKGYNRATAEMMARTTKTRPTMVSMARPKMTMAMEMRMGMTGMWAQKMQAYG